MKHPCFKKQIKRHLFTHRDELLFKCRTLTHLNLWEHVLQTQKGSIRVVFIRNITSVENFLQHFSWAKLITQAREQDFKCSLEDNNSVIYLMHLKLRRAHKEDYMKVGENNAGIVLQDSQDYVLSWGCLCLRRRGLKGWEGSCIIRRDVERGISHIC